MINKIILQLKKIVLPGFDKVPLWDVGTFFFKGITKGFITTRAAAISFSLFLAIFPAIIFLFTVIPYIPIEHFQDTLLDLLKNLTPKEAYSTIESTIEDIIKRPRGGLLSIGFILTLIFATNGINSLIEAFNNTYHSIEFRTTVKQYIVCIGLFFIISILLIITIVLIATSTYILDLLVSKSLLMKNIIYYILQFSTWLILIANIFFTFSFLYYLAPAKRKNFRFISAGSTLATALVILTTFGFKIYVSHFASYNKLYGSIGTLMIIMIWFYFNSIILIIGFELNASISEAQLSKSKLKLQEHSN